MLYANLRNLVLTILFLVMIKICFGFNSHNVQLCVVSFYFGYYLGKWKPPEVYVEINDYIFRLKNRRNNKPDAKLRNFRRFFLGKRFNNRERLSTKFRTKFSGRTF